MTDFNSEHNRAVWFDIPVADLDRAILFYRAVLAIGVHKERFPGGEFAVFDHAAGNGGCLVVKPAEVGPAGPLVYLNVNNRIRDAAVKAAEHGGIVEQPVHAIGPHGYRAVIRDSEGNRLALHSTVDA